MDAAAFSSEIRDILSDITSVLSELDTEGAHGEFIRRIDTKIWRLDLDDVSDKS